MNFADPEFVIKALLIAWNIGLTAAVWLRKPGLDAQEAVAALQRTVGLVETELRVITERIKHMPTGDEVNELARDMAAVKADNRAQTDALERVSKQLARIENFLLNNKP